MSARPPGGAPTVEAARPQRISGISNVTAFIGPSFEPAVVDIDVSRGRISDLRPAGGPATDPADGESVLDGSGLLAFPGMVDCHDHLRVLTPGLPIGEGVKLDEFLKVMWSTQKEMGPVEYRIGALLGSLQRLKTGMTTVVDHCYTFHAPGLDEASIEGYSATGVRWLYARGIMTRPYQPVSERWEEAESTVRRLVHERLVPRERLFVAPVSIRQATPDEFRRSKALADELGCRVYTHVAETAAERGVWQEECGATPIRALDALGFLSHRAILVHCVELDDEEIELLAARGVHVVHCPSNHMKLAKGFTRVPDLLAAGVNVALGIDMMADMLTEMRTEIGMHAANRLDPNAVARVDALRMATTNGARALGLEQTGLLARGMAADIVLLEARSLLQAPLIDPAYALLYATHAGMVRHVFVEGRWVIRDGVSTLVDEAALLEEAEDVATSYMRRIGFDDGPWFRRVRGETEGSGHR